MQFLLTGSVATLIGTVLFIVAQYLLRRRRSEKPAWPVNTGQREQSHIFRLHLARAGLECEKPILSARPFDLAYRTPHNRIYIAFASPLRPITASLLRDLNGAIIREERKIPIMIVHPKLATQEAVALASHAQIPLLRPSEIPALRDLIKAGRPIKRQSLLMLSYSVFCAHSP
jgi:hypothetical protein